jgi:chorismate synthase
MIRFLTAGESHGPELTGILDGMPAGLPLLSEDINRELLRRQQGECISKKIPCRSLPG